VKLALHTWWAARAPSERRTLLGATAVVLLALLWQWGLAPAIHTLRTAPRLQAEASAALWQIQNIAAEAQSLRERAAPASLQRAGTLQALEKLTTDTLGTTAVLQTGPDRVTVTLTNVAPPALAEWLSRARIDAHVRPVATQLNRAAGGDGAWSGTVVLTGEGLLRP
jgi:general secretion pathway protein M